LSSFFDDIELIGRSVAKSFRRRYEKRPQWTRRIVSQLLMYCQQKSACDERGVTWRRLAKRTDAETEHGFWERRRSAGEWVVARKQAGGTPALPGNGRLAALAARPTKPIRFATGI
jgi:hypothetical protein